jgi:hypothetical protein
MDRRTIGAALAVAAAFLLIYLPDVGRGFISDDFRWIEESRAAWPRHLVALFSANTGFYRPIVSMTFAQDFAVWGTNAFGYGLTNVALCLLTAAALVTLARRLGLSAGAAVVAAAVWLFNFHAVNMALLWLSGRTALLVSLFSVAAAYAMCSGRSVVAGLLALLAMLSKEEAVALPALFSAYVYLDERRVRALMRTIPLWIALAIYLLLRMQSGAFWASDAPSYYRFSFSLAVVARNALEYADRAGTVAAVVAIALAGLARLRVRDITAEERRVLLFAGLWILATYALTVFLPIRSSLYALLPSVGSALAAGVVASAASRRDPQLFRVAAVALMVLMIALNPVYRSRNVRWVRLAELSEDVMTTIARDAATRPSGHVVLIDAPEERFNLASAFGALFPDALRLRVGNGWTGEVVGSVSDAQGRRDLTYRLSDGALTRVER